MKFLLRRIAKAEAPLRCSKPEVVEYYEFVTAKKIIKWDSENAR
jgi:hypothetical protein